MANFSHAIDHCYRLDGKLVAIGVIDLLPHSVSSVYFLYHESISKFNPGKIGALREIALAAEQGYRWWYSGYYIHTCPKMKYKIDYSPTYILDPDSYEWLLLDKDMLAKFDERGYLHLPGAREPEIRESLQPEQEDARGYADENLFASGMPGMMTRAELDAFNLDNVVSRVHHGFFRAVDLFGWHSNSIDDHSTPKSVVAGLVALLGEDMMRNTCMDFRRPGKSM